MLNSPLSLNIGTALRASTSVLACAFKAENRSACWVMLVAQNASSTASSSLLFRFSSNWWDLATEVIKTGLQRQLPRAENPVDEAGLNTALVQPQLPLPTNLKSAVRHVDWSSAAL